jgi:Domain of unknown function (DUF6904)
MITIENTEQLTGVCITGDYDDFYNLVEAFHEITIDDYSEKHTAYCGISIRALGLCYDIRHAMQGDREIVLKKNGMNDDLFVYHKQITPLDNVNYSCNYIYPEMFFIMMALNDLIRLRAGDLSKDRYQKFHDKKVVWDHTITTLRLFQAQFSQCLEKTLSKASFSRMLGYLNRDYSDTSLMARQYIDFLNIEYSKLTREQRLKKLNSYAKRISEYMYDQDHREIRNAVYDAAKEHNMPEDEVRFIGMEYPDVIEW